MQCPYIAAGGAAIGATVTGLGSPYLMEGDKAGEPGKTQGNTERKVNPPPKQKARFGKI